MKNYGTIILMSGLLILLAGQAYGSVAVYPFRERVRKADLIVEGIVEKQMDNRSFDRKDLSSFRKKSIFKVSAVYKGNAAEGNSITVFSHMNFVCDTSSKLAEGRRYLLMLKKHKSGFADVNHGRGIWEIVTNESGRRVVVSDSWLKTNGESYEQFKNNIAWALSKPPSWPKAPAILYEQGKKIALEALSKANVDLKGFVYKEHKPQPLKIGNDIIGIAYKGDPMWYFRWIKPEVENISPMPPGTFIFCYVHAHTGKLHPNLSRKPVVKAVETVVQRLIPVVVRGQVNPPILKAGEPIPLTIIISNGLAGPIYLNTFSLEPTDWNGETINISLVDIYRDNRPRNLYYAKPQVYVPDNVSGMGRQEIKGGEKLEIKTDATKWKLHENGQPPQRYNGWLPGHYKLTLRVDNLTVDKYCRLLVLSEPTEFEITDSGLGDSFEGTGRTIDDLVSKIVTRAKSNDVEFFNKLLDGPYKGQEKKLIEMILRSGMASNYRERLRDKTPSETRLNYHCLGKGCSFQVDLIKQENNWSVKRIWFCK